MQGNETDEHRDMVEENWQRAECERQQEEEDPGAGYVGRINMDEARRLLLQFGRELGLDNADLDARVRELKIQDRKRAIAQLTRSGGPGSAGEIGVHQRALDRLQRAEQAYQLGRRSRPTRHTPGPWEVGPMHRSVRPPRNMVLSGSGEANSGYAICAVYGDNQRPANARLIAAAPELREQLSRTAASLAAAISLLENGGKQGAASDQVFTQMLDDYRNTITATKAVLLQVDGMEASS